MDKNLLIENTKNIKDSLNDLNEKYEKILIENVNLKNDKEFKSLEDLNKNITQLKNYYEFLLDYFENDTKNWSKYNIIVDENYLDLFKDNNTIADSNNIIFINKNIKNIFVEKINQIFNSFNLKKNKYDILDLNIKINFFLESIWDGFFPIYNSNRFVKEDYYHLINKLEIFDESKQIKLNNIMKNNFSKLIILSHKNRNKINLMNILLFSEKSISEKIKRYYCKIDIKDFIKFFNYLKNSKLTKFFSYFTNHVKFELTLYFPINDNFYKIDDINFNKFDYQYFKNDWNNLATKLDKNIKDNNINLKKLNLTEKPKNDNYFECKLITKININKLNNKHSEKNIIIHLSGGAFIINFYEFYKFHLNKIIEIKNSILYSIIYRLGPKYSYPDPLNDLINVYFYILEKYKNDKIKITLYGDSAGGHLICCLMNFLNLFNKKLPDKIILLYPGLNISNKFFNKGIFMTFEDPIWNTKLLIQVLDLIFKRKNINCENNILVNPSFFYDFIIEKYPKTIIFYSTQDPLYYSIINFFNILMKNKVDVKAYEFKNLYHGFISQVKKFNSNFKEINQILDIIIKEIEK